MEKVLTAIVTAYNEESRIHNVLEGFIDQLIDYQDIDFDIILVNDGSKDKTEEIMNQYKLVFNNMKVNCEVISIENAGLSNARNTGVKYVKTPYFVFVDADDKLDNTYFKKLTEVIIENKKNGVNLDLVKFNIETVDEKFNTISKNEGIKLDGLLTENILEKICFEDKLFMPMQLYAINTEFWNNNNFSCTKGIYHEDTDLTPKLILAAKNMIILDDYLYKYVQTENSITRTNNIKTITKKAEDMMYIYTSSKKYLNSKLEKNEITKKEYIVAMQFYTNSLFEKIKELSSIIYTLDEEKEKIQKEISNKKGENEELELKEYLEKLNSKIDMIIETKNILVNNVYINKIYNNIQIPTFKAFIKRNMIKFRIKKF